MEKLNKSEFEASVDTKINPELFVLMCVQDNYKHYLKIGKKITFVFYQSIF